MKYYIIYHLFYTLQENITKSSTSHQNKFKIAVKMGFSRDRAFVDFVSIYLDPIPRESDWPLKGILHPGLFHYRKILLQIGDSDFGHFVHK